MQFHMQLAMNNDYRFPIGDPLPRLPLIAEAGFSHINWCHHWFDDHFYSAASVRRIARELQRLGIRVLDLHASAGILAGVNSRFEPRRKLGAALLKNRINVCADLGGDAVALHVTSDASRRTLDEVAELCRRRNVRVAMENLPDPGHPALLESFLRDYDADFLGICYDTGHGNIDPEGASLVERHRHRLFSLHVNDNFGEKDQHLPPMDGTFDWENFIRILRNSSYDKPICLESAYGGSVYPDERKFLSRCYDAAHRLEEMRTASQAAPPRT